MNDLISEIENEFVNRFSGDYIMVESPGRVNLIGEHTDYNDGFVLPAAVDKSILLAIALNDSSQGRFYAVDKEEFFEADLGDDLVKSEQRWPNYLLGVVDQLREHGYQVSGFDCVFGGNVPIGAGMSSSAALEGGVLYGLTTLLDLEIGPVEMAKIAQKAENDFVGVQCGIMDQFVSLNGKAGHALKLDCRSLEYEFYPFNREDVHIVLCDTGVRRELADSEYNVRRSQCEQGVVTLKEFDDQIESLRDVNLGFLLRHQQDLDPVVFKRCKYVVEENRRVVRACRDLQKDDLHSFGQRMFQSHVGLQNEYEVSCRELDVLVDIAWEMNGVLGCRMMGGGFGGCTINLVEEAHLEAFIDQVKSRYPEETDHEARIYQTQVSPGTHLINQEDLTTS